jgi:hypothetical protein
MLTALIFTRKFSSPLFDIVIAVVFFAIAFWSFFLYQDSVDDGLKALGSIIYLIAISVATLLILVIIAVVQKRWFLTAPVILLALIWLVGVLLDGYRNSNKITHQNFAKNFPQIIQAVDNGDTAMFNYVVSQNKENFENIPNILYWQIKPENPKRLELIEVLVKNGYVGSDTFVFVIEQYYQKLSKEEFLMLEITTLLFEKRSLYQIYKVFNTLDYKYQSKYVRYFIEQLKIYNQGSSNPLYLYSDGQQQELIFNNAIENITLFNDEQKQNYFALLQILVEENKYFFSPEDFTEFLECLNDSAKLNLWDISGKDLETIKTILNKANK